MFTGIIEAIGCIGAVQMQRGDIQLTVHTGQLDMSDVAIGDSIATNGVCLTVISRDSASFCADVSVETLSHTLFAGITVGAKVNLEKALLPSSRMGGHMVTGHVDAVGEIIQRSQDARSINYMISAPVAIAHFIAGKGSITLDGVSLTVNGVKENTFSVNIVPHTALNTLLADYQVGDKIHLEVDIVSRYLERLLEPRLPPSGDNELPKPGLNMAKLAEFGFLK